MDDRADAELIRALAAGDLAGFDQLYDRFARPLYSLGLRWLDDMSDAEELVSETFTRAWLGAARFDDSRGTVASWLFGIARHVASDHWRRHRPVSRIDESPGRADEFETDRLIDAVDLAAALARLPSIHRDVLVMAYMEDRTEQQIATRLSIPIGTVKSRRFHGLRALARVVSPPTPAEFENLAVVPGSGR